MEECEKQRWLYKLDVKTATWLLWTSHTSESTGNGCQWLIPLTLAGLAWEAEIERTVVQGQPRQGICKTPISTNSWPWRHAPVIPIHAGRWDWEDDQSSRPAGEKSLQDFLKGKKSWVWWYTPVIPAMARSIKQENYGPGSHGQKVRLYLQNNQSKTGWRRGSSTRMLA
jgi:hypothetical protein